jgi:hypothetical protein
LIDEFNDILGFSLDSNRDLKRKHITSANRNGAKRLIVIGGSHTKRLVSGPGLKYHTVVDLSVPGWKPDQATISKILHQLGIVGVSPNDTIILDPLGNSAFCGTGAEGAPEQLYRDSAGKYHCPGNLSVVTSHMAKKVLDVITPVVEMVQHCKVILIQPILRYVLSKCCNDTNHIENFGAKTLKKEIQFGMETINELLHGWGEQFLNNFIVLDCIEAITNNGDAWEDDVLGGGPLWGPDDPVHMVPATYEALAASIIEIAAGVDDEYESEPAHKRQRVESVVVTVNGPPTRGGPPKRAAPIRPTWSSGEIVRPAVRGGANRGQRGQWGLRRPFRGSYRGCRGGQKRPYQW